MRLFFLLLTIINVCLADVFHPLPSERESLQVRVDLILKAKKSIDVTYYYWGSDRTSLEVLSLLREKARSGVRVRLIIDGAYNKIPHAIRATLLTEGVLIKEYNPLTFNPKSWVNRLHTKLLIIDEEVLLTGGRNLGNSYYSLPSKYSFLDLDVLIKGPVVKEASLYFEDLWNFKRVKFNIKKTSALEKEEGRKKLDEAYLGLSSHPFLKMEDVLNDNFEEVPPVDLVIDKLHTSSKKKVDPHFMAFKDLCRKASSTILIENAYVLGRPELLKVFSEAISRGVKVRILTNSLASANTTQVPSAYIGIRKKLVQMGVELYEYVGPHTIHTKAVVIDERWSLIGSYNFDYLSRDRNLEVTAVLDHEPTAKKIKHILNERLERAEKVNENGFSGTTGEKYPYAKESKKLKVQLLRFSVSPFLKWFY